MFGMSDPAQVIQQFERYAQEGRLEIAEVISTELVAKLLAEKGPDLETQGMLVRALRGNANILVLRGKSKLAANACALLLKHSKRLRKNSAAAKQQDMIDECIAAQAGDHILSAKAAIGLGRLSAARKQLVRAQRVRPGHVEAALLSLEARIGIKGDLRGAKSDALRLVRALEASGPVISHSGSLGLEPPEQDWMGLDILLGRLDAVSDVAGFDQRSAGLLRTATDDLRGQQQAIMAGEQAANAKLAAAIDTLNPTMDYHSYSKGN